MGQYYLYQLPELPDAKTYTKLAISLFETGNIESYKVMPLYPLWLGTNNLFTSLPVLDIIISSLTSLMVYNIIFQLSSKKKIALFGAIWMAIYPFSIFYASSGLTETLFTFLLLVGVYYLFEAKMIFASIAFVLSILVRPTFDFLYPILVLITTTIYFKENWKKGVVNVLKYTGVYMLLMSPWWMHNYTKYHEFVRLNLGSGEVLYAGNNPLNPKGKATEEYWSFDFVNHINNPIEKNIVLSKEAFSFINQNKLRFIKKCFYSVGNFWNITPNHEKYDFFLFKLASIMSIVPLIIGLILSFWFIDFRVLLPFILIMIYLTTIHAITIGSIRYRYPLEPLMLILASISFERLYEKVRQRVLIF
jgi:Gpi18-like mannosyltransferase